MIHYYDTLANITPENLNGFFFNWPKPPSKTKHFELLEKSAYRWIAVDDQTGNVVGFITAISDQVLAAYIPLLEVLPEYQGLGIGKQLVENMLSTLSEYYMVDLLCDPELQDYYATFNMHKTQGMLFRNYEKQNGR